MDHHAGGAGEGLPGVPRRRGTGGASGRSGVSAFRSLRTLVLAACVAAAGLAVIGGPEEAKATFPGANGPIVFEAHGSYSDGVGLDVFATDAEGAAPTNLTRDLPPASEERSPAFSADGKRIAYASDADHLGEDAQTRATDLYAMNRDGTGKVRLTSDGSASPYGKPAFSPDGRRVFFTGRDGGLYSVGVDGSGRTKLPTAAASWGDVDVSPDGNLVAFVGDAGSGTGNDGTIYVARSDGSGQRVLTQGAGEEASPRFLPDGRIVFSRALGYDASGPAPGRFLVNADGTNERRLSGGRSGFFPSPDGNLAVHKGADGLYVSALDGSGARRIVADTEGAGEISFTSQPDWGVSADAAVPTGVRVESLATDKATYAPGETVKATAGLAAHTAGTMQEVVVAARKKGGAEAPDFPVVQDFAVGTETKTLSSQRAFTETGTYEYFVGWYDGKGWNALTPTREFSVAQPAPAPAPAPTPTNTRPVILYPKPAPGSTTYDRTPAIQATVRDKETNLQRANITRVLFDGKAVTYFGYDPAADRLYFTPPAARGSHSVRIDVKDAQGLTAAYAWGFAVK